MNDEESIAHWNSISDPKRPDERRLTAERVDELLTANNAYLERARTAEAQCLDLRKSLEVVRQSLRDQASARLDPTMPILRPEVLEELSDLAEAAYGTSELERDCVVAHALEMLVEWQKKAIAERESEEIGQKLLKISVMSAYGKIGCSIETPEPVIEVVRAALLREGVEAPDKAIQHIAMAATFAASVALRKAEQDVGEPTNAEEIERVAEALWRSEAEIGTPSVRRYRAVNRLADELPETAERWRRLARAALNVLKEN